MKNRVLYNLADHEKLANILSLGRAPILVVTDPDLMRGFDYRCSKGIHLYMLRQVKCHRDWIQALMRVGRNNDPCERFTSLPSDSYIDSNAHS